MHLPTFDTQLMNPRDCFDLGKEILFSVLPSWILNVELINKQKGEIKNTTNKTASLNQEFGNRFKLGLNRARRGFSEHTH